MTKQPRIKTFTDSYVVHYPEFVEFANTQLEKCFWTSNEIAMEKDKQDMLVNMTEAERHAVTTALKLFVKYEIFVGTEYWLTRVMNTYPRPEIQRMASVFGMMELAVHAPFYNKLNEVLGLNTDEFYTSYVDDPVLNDRVKFLDSIVGGEDDLLSLAAFSIIEGAVLFSSFAMFKNFQSNGNNLISNTVRGINQSVIDEGLHQQAGAALFRKVLKELKIKGETLDILYGNIEMVAEKILQHEERIVDMLFEKGPLRGITAEQMKAFVAHRVNVCLDSLGVQPIFDVKDHAIEEWFYTAVQGYQAIDFFTGVGREYTRSWNEKAFEWVSKESYGKEME
jgi:ribonucleotide reductase beta subunit family protein with ferritin-like domain